MSKRCRLGIYVLVGCVGVFVFTLLIKILCFSGLFVPLLKLEGKQQMEIEVNTAFVDPGVKARYHLTDYSDDIQVNSTLNTHKLGTYEITYESKGHQKKVTREVRVVDTTPPKFHLKGDNTVRIFMNGEFQEAGYEVKDNYDQQLQEKVTIKNHVNNKKKGTYKIEYEVKDSSGNVGKAVRKVQVCDDPTSVKLYYNHDTYDNKMEEWWFRKSKDHKRTTAAQDEQFLLKYNTFFQGPDEKVIYLTFDEGGNDITYIKEIAEVLKKNDVQATYFLTLNYIRDNPEFMRELVKDGNLIGNHTWHHYDMTTLANASGVDKFVKEITETEKTYMQVTGKPMVKVFRFPKGGSSERAMKMVSDLGYRTYNWSHAYYDYASDVSGEEALKTMMDHYHNGAIYLLHPSNKGNYEAMDTFIKNMKDLGYTFKTVDTISNTNKK
ncbi:immunoglobulin-like domain-containing protein [Amedibacillus sp. YH-ame10]